MIIVNGYPVHSSPLGMGIAESFCLRLFKDLVPERRAGIRGLRQVSFAKRLEKSKNL